MASVNSTPRRSEREKVTDVSILWQQRFPHSLGLLYSAFTYYTGFKVNSGEYKLMGLAPYGRPTYVDRIYQHLVDLRPDGSFRLNMQYFGFLHELQMTNRAFEDLFAGPPRAPESEITRREMDLARSIQVVTEEIMLRMARAARSQTNEENLCLAGGVALNCVANGVIATREDVSEHLDSAGCGRRRAARWGRRCLRGIRRKTSHEPASRPRRHARFLSRTQVSATRRSRSSSQENGYPYRAIEGDALGRGNRLAPC